MEKGNAVTGELRHKASTVQDSALNVYSYIQLFIKHPPYFDSITVGLPSLGLLLHCFLDFLPSEEEGWEENCHPCEDHIAFLFKDGGLNNVMAKTTVAPWCSG